MSTFNETKCDTDIRDPRNLYPHLVQRRYMSHEDYWCIKCPEDKPKLCSLTGVTPEVYGFMCYDCRREHVGLPRHDVTVSRKR